jgi:hypothetical protein
MKKDKRDKTLQLLTWKALWIKTHKDDIENGRPVPPMPDTDIEKDIEKMRKETGAKRKKFLGLF